MNISFIEELEKHCKSNDVPYNYIEKIISSLINSDAVQNYYITKGFIQTQQDVILDLIILTSNELVGISYKKDGDLDTLKISYKDITNITLEIKNGKKYAILDIGTFKPGTPYGWRLVDKFENKDKLEKFLNEVFKKWKK